MTQGYSLRNLLQKLARNRYSSSIPFSPYTIFVVPRPILETQDYFPGIKNEFYGVNLISVGKSIAWGGLFRLLSCDCGDRMEGEMDCSSKGC